jgi:hypothetical protein
VGHWQVEVIVRQPGVNDVRHTFVVMIQAMTPMAATLDQPVSQIPPPVPGTSFSPVIRAPGF